MVEVGHMAVHTELDVVVYTEQTSQRSGVDGRHEVHCPHMVIERRSQGVGGRSHCTHSDLHRGYSHGHWHNQE